jgi:Ca2+/Na+ antiporter
VRQKNKGGLMEYLGGLIFILVVFADKILKFFKIEHYMQEFKYSLIFYITSSILLLIAFSLMEYLWYGVTFIIFVYLPRMAQYYLYDYKDNKDDK